jgi:hypothetical protein
MGDGLGTEISVNRNVSIEAARRAQVVLKCVDSLLPGATPQRRRRLASRILSMCWDDAAGFTQAQAEDLIAPHLQCIARNCPLCVFWEPISRSIRLFFDGKE